MKTHLILSAAVLLSLVPALEAKADGGFVTTTLTPLNEPEQKAIILFRDGRQDLILEVSYEGSPEDFVWLVPVPTRPEISVDVPEVFAEMTRQSVTWTPPSALVEWDGSPLVGAPPGPVAQPRASIWDFTVLPPGRGNLRRWLHERGITPSTHARVVLESYVRKGWYFVGMTIGSEGRNLEMAKALRRGTIQPVRFRFATPEPVFPLKVSAINPGFSDILLYVFADQALVNRSAALAGWNTRCYGRIPPPPGLDRDGVWNSPGRPGPFLTRLQARFHAWEMAEDVYFRGYDPRADLRSQVRGQRLGALAWIGAGGDRRWTAELLRLGDSNRLDASERATLAWALGRLGDPSAAPLLARLAESGLPARWEAVRSLLTIDPRAASELLLADLGRLSRSGLRGDRRLDEARFLVDGILALPGEVGGDLLVALAGLDSPPAHGLHLLAGDRGNPGGVTTALAAMAILAGRGDARAQEALAVALASTRPLPQQQASLPGREMYMVAIVDGSSPQRSRVLRPGQNRDGPVPADDWPALNLVYRLLAARPGARDAVLRAAADAPDLPGEARILLLGLVNQVDRRDLAWVRQQWSGAIQDGGRMNQVSGEGTVRGGGLGHVYPRI